MKTRSLLCLFSVFLISCGKKESNVIHYQDHEPKKEQPEQPEQSATNPISGFGCAYADNKEELMAVFRDNLLPTETFRNFYYTEKRCGPFKFLFFEGNSCTTRSGLGPRHGTGIGIRHEMAATREQLNRIILDRIEKSASHEMSFDGSQHRIMDHKTGAVWHLNLCLPLIAQPTYKIVKN